MPRNTAARLFLAGALSLAVAACGQGGTVERDASARSANAAERSGPPPSPSPVEPAASASPSPSTSGSATGSAARSPTPSISAAQKSPMRRAWLSIPALGINRLRVDPYVGTADDAPGTRIQDRGIAASPRGPRGGVGPGEVGNFIVTGHRTSHGAPFRTLPSLRRGAHVYVTSGGLVYDYVVTRTMIISFRDKRSRASQSAPVPGFLDRKATEASITLSTCRTPEDHAEGNFWSDALGNPEHRIDKVGVLRAVRPA